MSTLSKVGKAKPGLIDRVLKENEFSSLQEMFDYYLKHGHGPYQISLFLGVHRRTVHGWAAEAGVTLPKRCEKRAFPKRPMPPQALAASREACTRWIDWRGQRVSLQDAAKRLGITGSALAYRLDNWNNLERAMTERRDPNAGGRTR